jgi:hypothetical protein
MKVLLILLSLFLIIGCSQEFKEVGNMKLTSPAFENKGKIPSEYSCGGDDVNPELDISDVPADAKTLALVMDDPDAPAGTWVHWVIWNMPVVSKIGKNSLPDRAVQGKNSWGRNDYGGPCPPSGTHRYFFKLYALDTELDLDENADKKDLENAMKGHILAQAQLMGKYSR